MSYKNYSKKYELHKVEYDKYFGYCADSYWEMYSLYHKEKEQLNKIAEKYKYSPTSIFFIFKSVEFFLDNVIEASQELQYSIQDLTNELYMHSEIMDLSGLSSMEAIMIYHVCCYLVQNYRAQFIPQDTLLEISKVFSNNKKRGDIISELKAFVIKNNNDEIIVYREIIVNKDGIYFEFSDEFLDYLLMSRAIVRLYSV